jgi:hypothetical protein
LLLALGTGVQLSGFGRDTIAGSTNHTKAVPIAKPITIAIAGGK